MATITVNVNASFSALSDSPNSYVGQAGKFVVVKGTEDGVEFQDLNADNLFTDDLTLAANRTHDLNGNSVTFLKSNFEFRSTDGLSTTKPVIIRNHTNTANGFEFNGDGTYRLGDFSGTSLSNAFTHLADGRLFMAKTGTNFIELNPSGQNRMYNLGGWLFDTNLNSTSFWMSGGRMHLYRSVVQLNNNVEQANDGATLAFLIENGTAPSANKGNMHWYYSADRGGVDGKASAHFRCEDGTVNVIGDLSGFGTITPTSRLEAQALNGNSGERVFGLRNHTNTGWLAEFRNDGQTYFGGNIYVPNIFGMYLASNSGTPSSVRTSFGALFIEAFSTIGIFAENKPLIASINNYPALVYSAISLETPDVTLWNGSLSFYVDEVNNDIKIKVKKSDGTIFTKTI